MGTICMHSEITLSEAPHNPPPKHTHTVSYSFQHVKVLLSCRLPPNVFPVTSESSGVSKRGRGGGAASRWAERVGHAGTESSPQFEARRAIVGQREAVFDSSHYGK